MIGVDMILVAGGKIKRPAIRAMLEGGFARTLVADIKTGIWLISE